MRRGPGAMGREGVFIRRAGVIFDHTRRERGGRKGKALRGLSGKRPSAGDISVCARARGWSWI